MNKNWYYAPQADIYEQFTEEEWGARYDFSWVFVGDDEAKKKHEVSDQRTKMPTEEDET